LVRPGVFTDNELHAESEFGAPRQYQAAPSVNRPLKISFFVGDEVTSLKFLRFLKDKLETPYVVSYFFNRRLTCEVEIRATHEIMAARAAQLALFVDQLMTALRTISPVLAGNVFVGWRGTGVLMKIVRRN
jgi:hypothetical protein